MEDFLAKLNDRQRESVLLLDTPLLVVAGAGSGKTRVITEKIRYVASRGVPARNILAITFTNKAAGEMKRRVEGFVDGAWISTFHSLCARLLRIEAEHAGLSAQFSIYDAEDQRRLVKNALDELKLDSEEWDPRDVVSRISRLKSGGVGPDDLDGDSPEDSYLARIYKMYQHALRSNQALDFDDLLLTAIRLLESSEIVRNRYQERFRHILVDEYQDTNVVQSRLLKLLSGKTRNVTVTGDPDQAIYSWRGADISNILRFQEDYPGARIITLEENYRSTRKILDLANQLIRNNKRRYPKELRTANREGSAAVLHSMRSAADEAFAVARAVSGLRSSGEKLRDMAVFYRTNAQSRLLEDALRRGAIPYIIVGGVRFFERMEVKDMIAFLRFIANPSDGVSLMRVINRPTRGIGEDLKSRIAAFAMKKGVSAWKAICENGFRSQLSSRQRKSIEDFREMAGGFFALAEAPPARLLEAIIKKTGLVESYAAKQQDAEEDKAANIMEFLAFVTEFCGKNPEAGLSDILENIALLTDKKEGAEDSDEVVTLMTLHAAKGLEFPFVFLTGLNEGILPHQRSIEGASEDAMEEERRLCYVGITRTRRELHLYSALERGGFDRVKICRPSRFLAEMSGEHLATGDGGGSFAGVPRSGDKEKIRSDALNTGGRRFRMGDPVRHKDFGKGVILRIYGNGSLERARIYFQKCGEKNLVLGRDSLEPLS